MEQSDEEHILTQPRILELLDITEHITISRQTFYRSIAILKDFGFDIETYSDNHTGYYLRTRPFSPEEALFLCHAIDSSNDISDIEKSKVKESFLKFLSKPMSKEVLHTLSTRSIRNKNDEILINLRILAKAIYHEKMICFDYFHYNIKKEKILNDRSFNLMEPRFLVSKDAHYYLVTSGGRHQSISHYRVDRMTNIKILDEDVCDNEGNGRQFNYQDAYNYAYTSIFMFSGSPILFQLRCDKNVPNIYDKMIDEFGNDVRFEDVDSNCFDVYVHAVPAGMLILAQKYIDCFQIMSPIEYQYEMKVRISLASQLYSKY